MASPIDNLPVNCDALRTTLIPPMFVRCGSMFCAMEVWSEGKWSELARSKRPVATKRVPGLGLVVAVPIECMN
jgi:hypothetical protein